jgi:hypothetical protein
VTTWLRVIAAVVGMGLIWAAVWAAAGALIGIVDPRGSLEELWVGPAIGMHPGFVGGVAFAAVLGITARPRRFADLTVPTVVAHGGAVGLLLGLLPFGINKLPGATPLWLVAAVVICSMTLMSVVSAAGSLALAKWARPRGTGGSLTFRT